MAGIDKDVQHIEVWQISYSTLVVPGRIEQWRIAGWTLLSVDSERQAKVPILITAFRLDGN